MSGAGGYFKYRCKYFLTYNCPNWVWVNNAPCAHCLADGRDSDSIVSIPFRISREVFVPQLKNGSIHYTIVEIVAAGDGDSGWVVKGFTSQALPVATGPSAVSFGAMAGFESQRGSKMGLQPQAEVLGWSKTGISVE